MNDEVLRMRAAVVTDEALASLRSLGKELGLVGRNVNMAHARREMTGLQSVFSGVSREIRNFTGPALSQFRFAGAGAAGAAAAVALAVQQMTKAAKEHAEKIRDVSQTAQSLGLTTRELKAFTLAGEQAGISASTMGRSLASLSSNWYDFKRNLNADGGVADTLRQMGQGDLVNSLKEAGSRGDAIDLVQQRLEYLQKVDPERAKRVSEAIYGDPGMVNLSREAIRNYFAQVRELTEEQKRAAEEMNKAFTEMHAAWSKLTGKATETIMPGITVTLQAVKEVLSGLDAISAWIAKQSSAKGDTFLPPAQTKPGSGARDWRLPGFRPMSFGADDGTGSVKDTLAEGVFEGLLRFSQYQSGGGGSGFQNAALSGGGGGSGGLAGAFPGNSDFPRVHGSGVTGSGAGPSAGSVSEAVRNMVPGLTGGDKVGGAFMEGRQRFAKELADNPALKEKLFGIVMGENKDDKAGRSVMESAMNRAVVRGTSLAAQLKLHAQSGINEGGYYAGFRPRDVARYRERLEGQLKDVLAGSNVSDYATDNASSWLAEKHKRNNTFRMRKEYGKETFFSPDSRISKQYDRWRALVAESERSKVAGTPDAEDIDFERGGFSRRALGGYSRKPIDPGMTPAPPFGSRGGLLDQAIAPAQQPVNAQGSVEIVVKNGSQIETKSSGELFQDTRVTKMRQQPTMIDRGGYSNDAGF